MTPPATVKEASPRCTLNLLATVSPEELEKLSTEFKNWILPTPEVANTCLRFTVHVDTQNHPPIRGATRRYASKILEEVQAKATKLLREGIIEPSQSAWCSWPVMVKKPDESYRMCIDYSPLNAITKHLAVPMQSVDDLLDCAHGAVYLSKIDIN